VTLAQLDSCFPFAQLILSFVAVVEGDVAGVEAPAAESLPTPPASTASEPAPSEETYRPTRRVRELPGTAALSDLRMSAIPSEHHFFSDRWWQ
jgi:hypothetical protein